MGDSEFSISQLTGHITIKRDDSYISKTKDLTETKKDLDALESDIDDKYTKLTELEDLNSKIDSIEDQYEEAVNKVNELTRKLEEYEDLSKQIDSEINEIDDYLINNLLPSLSENYGYKINSNIKLLGNLLVAWEALDIIIDAKNYFDTFVNQIYNYYDKNGNVSNWGVISVHNENKVEIDKRVDKQTYLNKVAEIEKAYSDFAAQYGLTGSYKIEGGY